MCFPYSKTLICLDGNSFKCYFHWLKEMVNYEKVNIVSLTTPGKILETLHGGNFL